MEVFKFLILAVLDIHHSRILYDPPPRILEIKAKINKWDLIPHIRCPKYWSFSFSISPSNEYSRLISFRTDLFDLLVVQGQAPHLWDSPGKNTGVGYVIHYSNYRKLTCLANL